jgi:hypothetical protein
MTDMGMMEELELFEKREELISKIKIDLSLPLHIM